MNFLQRIIFSKIVETYLLNLDIDFFMKKQKYCVLCLFFLVELFITDGLHFTENYLLTTLRNRSENPPRSIEGIIDLLKTFTGNSSLDVNTLKDHLLQVEMWKQFEKFRCIINNLCLVVWCCFLTDL